MENEMSILTNKWFLNLEADEVLKGQILGAITPDKYLVHLYSWVDGEAIQQVIINLDQLQPCEFYDSRDEMERRIEAIMEECA